MTSLLNLERFTQSSTPEPPVAEPEPASAPQAPVIIEEYEYEIVLGRSQFAGIGLLATVLVAVVSGVSYLIGKSASPRAEAPAISAPVIPVPTPAPPVALAPTPRAQQPPLQQTQNKANPTGLFGEVVTGQQYLQVGIIEKGSAATWAEGLRTHGLDAFVAPGPADGRGMWRVLVGPLPNPQDFDRAKNTMDALGIPNFARTF
jgi:hypothetical protein